MDGACGQPSWSCAAIPKFGPRWLCENPRTTAPFIGLPGAFPQVSSTGRLLPLDLIPSRAVKAISAPRRGSHLR